MAKRRKARTVHVEAIGPTSEPHGPKLYALLAQLVGDHHEDLAAAKIVLLWNTAWKPNRDGHVTLGRCRIASDLERELHGYDVLIQLRRFWWTDPEVTDAQRAALLDHELSHATTDDDDQTGEPKVDERGRRLYRLRRHDIEEFAAVVKRHGLYKRDLEQFAGIVRSRQLPLPMQPRPRLVPGDAQPGAGAAPAPAR